MDDVPALLRRLVTTDPGRPRVTWYGPAGERVELSGKVLDNWVAKTANLLVDELDVGPGSRVVVDLPPHWRTLVWLLAVWAAGGCVVVEHADAGGGEAGEQRVGDEPGGAEVLPVAADEVVAGLVEHALEVVGRVAGLAGEEFRFRFGSPSNRSRSYPAGMPRAAR